MLQKELEQFKFLQRQLHPGVPGVDRMGRGVHPQIAHLQQSGGSRGSRPAQNRPDTGHHLHHAEGLGQIIVRAQVQPHHFIVFRPPGGRDDDRDAGGGRIAPEGFENFDAVHPGQHNIQHNQLGLGMAQGIEQPHAVPEALRLEAGRPQGIQHQLPDAVVILYAVNHSDSPNTYTSF